MSGVRPESWQGYEWPTWVPDKIREQVEAFWGVWGRTPRAWAKDAADNNAPALGDHVRLTDLGVGVNWVEGRYVHAWNNIGRLVTDDGGVVCVSLCYYQPLPPGADGREGE